MALSVKGIEKAVRDGDHGKHFDGGGLYLELTKAGGQYWRYKYRLGGKEKSFSIGTLADVTLGEARIAHAKAREQVKAGNDPVAVRKDAKAAKDAAREGQRPFRDVAALYRAAMIPATASQSHQARTDDCIDYLNAGFGPKDIAAVEPGDLSLVLGALQAAGKFETRYRVQRLAIKIVGWAVVNYPGVVKHNVFLNVQYGDGYTSHTKTRESRLAIVEPAPFGQMLRDIDHEKDGVKLTLVRLLALVGIRPGELCKAQWKHIDWSSRTLIVPPGGKMEEKRKATNSPRAGENFEVPLSRQAITELRKLEKITGTGDYLFPATGELPHLHRQEILRVLQRAYYGDKHSGHGFRSSFSSIMNKERMKVEGKTVLRWPEQGALIEVQLDHDDASTRAIYNRGGLPEERRELMQAWADRIDEMRGTRKLALAA